MLGTEIVLYLVLTSKPRFDESNEIGRYADMAACHEIATGYNDLAGYTHESLKFFMCMPAPSPIDDWGDIVVKTKT